MSSQSRVQTILLAGTITENLAINFPSIDFIPTRIKIPYVIINRADQIAEFITFFRTDLLGDIGPLMDGRNEVGYELGFIQGGIDLSRRRMNISNFYHDGDIDTIEIEFCMSIQLIKD